ncbi:hypothetical protein EW026_g2318 [Hermanssonia centrifuga]|uniref:AAA+ ATPase domain-containing protein n=1 Tax=Hermanssonia centrifuga TaxID=98765 RepID=A0A4S4KNR8_9APHY|nr:hypothetical protein EW026_g2318 [Hermanssonia centrifuga]
MSVNAIFHHAANMTFLDGLGSLAQLSSYSQSALAQLREEALVKLKELAPIAEESLEDTAISDSSEYIQLGSFSIPRGPGQANPNLFSFQAPTTRDNVNRVVRASQLMKPILLEGSPGVGKTSLVSALANICGYRLCRINLSDQTDLVDLFGSDLPVEGGGPGHKLQEISINAATDATDILGSFEEVDLKSRVAQLLGKASILLARMIASMKGSRLPNAQQFVALAKSLQMSWSEDARLGIMEKASSLLNDLEDLRMPNPAKQTLTSVLNELLEVSQRAGRFEWIDGPLVRALREGLWICLDGANLCNPSVLDRLNSLCEADGMLILNERGAVNGQVETIRPHTNFRLFMCVDSHFGELSRAMRNRGVEVALLPAHHAEDKKRLLDHMRLPSGYAASTTDFYVLPLHYELVRRGLTIVEQPAAVTGLWPSDMLLDEDTLSSSIVAISETLSLCTQLSPAGFRAVMYFTAHIFNDPACNPYPMANAADRPGSSVQERTLHASMSVVRALIDAAHNLYAFIDVTVNTAKADLAAMLHLLNCAGYLKKVVSDSTLDYSAMHVVSQLLHESLREPRQHLSEVLVSVQALSDMVALKSGLGMSEIWKALSAPNVSDADMTKLLQLDNAAVALPRDMQDTRPRILQLMAMSTLPMSYPQQDDLDTLINKLQTQIPSHMEAEKGLQRRHLDPSSLITELGFLASLYGYLSDPSETFIRTAQEVLKLACQDPSSSLLRLVPYQHAIWSAEAGRPMLPLIADMHRQWLESIWDVKEQAGLEGPSLLLVPVELLNTIAHCDHDVQTLLLLDTYEVTLGRHIRSLLAQSIPTADRLTQLTIVLSQCILMVSSSFRHALEPAEYTALVSLPNHTAFVPGSNQWPELLTHLERANHAAFGAAVKRHLRPYICRIDSESKDMRCVIGEGWIAFARLLLELFVPDAPIDPAALQKCYQDFGNEERAVLTFQISMHEDLEMRTSGDRSNGTISYLEKMLAEGDAKLPKYDTPAPTRSRNDIARLHTYWSEVQQFLNQVLSPHKLEAYISIAISGDPGALAREHVIQNSIFAFSQRLNTVYKDFEDINMPIQLALSSMRLGLRLVTDSGKLEALTSPDAKVPLARGLLASPSVRSAELIRIQTSPSEASEFSSSLLMTKLSGIVFQVMLGSDLRDYMHEVDQVYERALGLWLVDLSRAEESEREAQSLYRRKIEEDFKEDETEEEFLSMFPEFEDVLDDHIPSQAKISPQRPLLIGASSILQLFEMHQRALP